MPDDAAITPTPAPGRAGTADGAGTATDPKAPADTDVTAVIAAELRLLDPAVRRVPELVDSLLHPDFSEFGASGTVWDRPSITALLAEPPDPGARPATASRMRGVRLAPDLVHLTFDTDDNGRRAHRSSLWRRTDQGWRLYFHQGTLFGRDTPSDTEPPTAAARRDTTAGVAHEA